MYSAGGSDAGQSDVSFTRQSGGRAPPIDTSESFNGECLFEIRRFVTQVGGEAIETVSTFDMIAVQLLPCVSDELRSALSWQSGVHE